MRHDNSFPLVLASGFLLAVMSQFIPPKKKEKKNFALNRNVAAVFRNAQRGLRDQLEQTVSFHKTS